jgi:hypothetical protein
MRQHLSEFWGMYLFIALAVALVTFIIAIPRESTTPWYTKQGLVVCTVKSDWWNKNRVENCYTTKEVNIQNESK